MKTISMTTPGSRKGCALVLGAALFGFMTLGVPQMARAVVYEGFNYTNGSDLTAVSTSATGLSGNWTSTGGIVGTVTASSLAFGDLATSGGALQVTKPTGGGWQFLSAPVGAGGALADGSTLYGSFLFSYNGVGGTGAGRNFGLSVGNDTGANHTLGLLSHAYVSNPNTGRIGYTDGDFGALTYSEEINTLATTYLFVGKWTNLGGASTATAWVMSLANFNAISSGGVTELEMSSNNIATNTDTGTAGSFGTSQFVKIGDFMDANVNFLVDEVRFGGSLNDVVVVVPEPGSAMLAGLAGLALALRRRRR